MTERKFYTVLQLYVFLLNALLFIMILTVQILTNIHTVQI